MNNDLKKACALSTLFLLTTAFAQQNYTVLDANRYHDIVKNSRLQISQLLTELQPYCNQTPNKQIEIITQHLKNIPYIYSGAMGEGDWQPTSDLYRPDAIHVKQDPLYRLDRLDCQTFVQVVMALYHAKTLNQFDHSILKIAYGADENASNDSVHYYNRNNFVDGDWNPNNEKNGWLADVTSKGALAPYSKKVTATITRQNWFSFQQKELADHVRVLAAKNGPAMTHRFTTLYSALHYPRVHSENIVMSYLPKESIALKQSDGSYLPNQMLLNKIPTPAVVEIIRDPKKWVIGHKNIKAIIGTELTVSHLGLIYRKTFHRGDLIYHKIMCSQASQQQKMCSVVPITCEKNQCKEIMFVHATDAYPDGYYWYRQQGSANGNYTCSAKKPPSGVAYTLCNRVMRLPLFNYLTDYQYGSYPYMTSPSIVGIHVESLL